MALRPPRTLQEGDRTAIVHRAIIFKYIKYQRLTVMIGKY